MFRRVIGHLPKNVFSEKCFFGIASFRENVNSGLCPFWLELVPGRILRENAFSNKCLFWQVFFGQMHTIRSGAPQTCNQSLSANNWTSEFHRLRHLFVNNTSLYAMHSRSFSFISSQI